MSRASAGQLGVAEPKTERLTRFGELHGGSAGLGVDRLRWGVEVADLTENSQKFPVGGVKRPELDPAPGAFAAGTHDERGSTSRCARQRLVRGFKSPGGVDPRVERRTVAAENIVGGSAGKRLPSRVHINEFPSWTEEERRLARLVEERGDSSDTRGAEGRHEIASLGQSRRLDRGETRPTERDAIQDQSRGMRRQADS